MVFDSTFTYKNHVNYVKKKKKKKKPQSSGYFKSSRPQRQGADRKTLPLSIPSKILTGLRLHCILGSLKTYSTETRSYPSPRFPNCSRSFSYFRNKSVCKSTRTVSEQQVLKKSLNYVLKLKTCPNNPAIPLIAVLLNYQTQNSLKNPV